SDVHLLLAGDASEYTALARDLSPSSAAARIHVSGYLDDGAVDAHLAAADACVCLRWPTALESSASWLQCLAAGRPTIVGDLPAHFTHDHSSHARELARGIGVSIDIL